VIGAIHRRFIQQQANKLSPSAINIVDKTANRRYTRRYIAIINKP